MPDFFKKYEKQYDRMMNGARWRILVVNIVLGLLFAPRLAGLVSRLGRRLDHADRIGARKGIFQALVQGLFKAVAQVFVVLWTFLPLRVSVPGGVVPITHRGPSKASC
jgi:hypothetical protein